MKTATLYYGDCDEPREPTTEEIQRAGNLLGCTLVQDDTLLEPNDCEPPTTWLAPPEMMYVVCRIEGEPKSNEAKETDLEVYIEELPWLGSNSP